MDYADISIGSSLELRYAYDQLGSIFDSYMFEITIFY